MSNKSRKKKTIKRVYQNGREILVAPKSKSLLKEIVARQNSFHRPAKKITHLKHRHLTHPAKKAAAFIDRYDLPLGYNKTRLTFLVKDPFWIYAYWEVAAKDLQNLLSPLSAEDREKSKLVLRVYDVTLIDFNGKNANLYFDIEVGSSNNWYINLYNDCASFVGELGLRTLAGKFLPLVRSNYVQTSRMGYAARSEQIWMKVTDKQSSPPFIFSRKIPLRSGFSHKPSAADASKRQRIYISEDEIRTYYSKLSPLLREIILSRLGYIHNGKAKSYVLQIEGDSELERNKILSSLPKGYFLKQRILGSSMDIFIIDKAGASESISSDFKVKPQEFFFELSTELVVYGRTKPGAEVWLKDKQIKLNPDGTFSLRLALPDGEVPLAFKAVSADKKEKRNINTQIKRNTSYFKT